MEVIQELHEVHSMIEGGTKSKSGSPHLQRSLTQ